MRVVIADVRDDHLKDARAWFVSQKQSRRIKCVKLDVTNRRGYARAADQAEKAFGKIHVLVNNAGLGLLGAIDKTKYDDWDWGLAVMIGGVINGLLTVLPRIRAHGEGGHVVNTASIGGFQVHPGWNTGAYSMTKYAVVALSEALDQDLAGGQLDRLPGPGQVISALAGHLEGRIDRRALLDSAAEGREPGPDRPILRPQVAGG